MLRRAVVVPDIAISSVADRIPAPARWLGLSAFVLGAASAGTFFLAITQYRIGFICSLIAAFGLFIMNLTGWVRPLVSPESKSESPTDSTPPSRATGWPLIGVAFVACAVAVVIAVREVGGLMPLVPWLVSIIAMILAFDDSGPRLYSRDDWLFASALFAVALVSRTLLLERVPPGIHGDEADWAQLALKVLNGESPPFAFLWLGYPGTSLVPHSIALYLFGPTLGAVRLGSGVVGALAIPGLYLLARRAFDRDISVIAALLLLFNVAHFHFSRMGLPNVEALPVALFGAASLLAVAADPKRLRQWCLLGVSFGLSLLAYLTTLVWPIIAALALTPTLLVQIRSGSFRSVTTGLIITSFAALVTTAPLLVWAGAHPDALGKRVFGLTVWSQEGRAHSADALGLPPSDTFGILKVQLERSIEAVQSRGDSSLQYGSQRALLDPVCAVGLLLGLASLLCAWRRAMSRLMAVWLVLTLLLGSVILVDPPFAPRLVTLLPAACLVAAVGIYQTWAGLLSRWDKRGHAAALAGILSVVMGASLGFGYYFGDYWRNYPGAGITALARYIRSVQDQYTFYFVGLNEPTNYVTLQFMAPRAEILRWDPDQPAPPIGRHESKIFLMPMQGDPARQAAELVSSRYPRHQEQYLTDVSGRPIIRLLEVDEPKGSRN